MDSGSSAQWIPFRWCWPSEVGCKLHLFLYLLCLHLLQLAWENCPLGQSERLLNFIWSMAKGPRSDAPIVKCITYFYSFNKIFILEGPTSVHPLGRNISPQQWLPVSFFIFHFLSASVLCIGLSVFFVDMYALNFCLISLCLWFFIFPHLLSSVWRIKKISGSS